MKGEALIYTDTGEVPTIPLEEAMTDYLRPECQHCGDCSAEVADISYGGIGADRAIVVVLRTQKAVDIWEEFEATGRIDVWSIESNMKAWNILQRLARRHRDKVPGVLPMSGTERGLPRYPPKEEFDPAIEAPLLLAKPANQVDACLERTGRATDARRR